MSSSAFVALRKHPVIGVAFIVTILVLVWGFWPKPIAVELLDVKRGPLQVTIEEEGRTRVIDRYVISAPVNGVACQVSLNVGDSVDREQALLAITPLPSQVLDSRSRAQAQAKVAAAEAALHAAQQQAQAAADAAELAATELTRQQSLLERQLVSRDVVDRVKTEARTKDAAKRSADFMVEVAGYDVQAARTALEYSAANANDTSGERVAIESPINGKILKIHHECEGPVSTGQPLLEVGDPTALEVEVDVLSADAVKINQGMEVIFKRWGGDNPLRGIVRTVEPVGFTKISALGVEEQRVLVISDFTSPAEEWQRVGDGYRVEASFVLWQGNNVLQVPTSSLFRYDGHWAVFVEQNGRAERRQVSIGQRNGLAAQIVDGLNEGEVVINHPNDEIDTGTRVKPYQ